MSLLRLKILGKLFTHKSSSLSIETDNSFNGGRVFLFLAADYGNLGDVAITYAQNLFLKIKFSAYEMVEIPISKTISGIKSIKKNIKRDDIISIVGGGNMGDLYDDIEFLRQLIVLSFPKNRIYSFPQTIDFSDTRIGRRRLRFAKWVYNRHTNLVLMAREPISYDRMKRYFPKADVRLLPDIAMTLDCRNCGCERDGVMMCMRDDKERSLSWDIEPLISDFERNGYTIKKCDTHIGRGNLSVEEREKELSGIWSAISHSKLIVTDRLHGMIFAFITGTPALVLPNSNFKIEKSFEWIKQCGYVVFCPQKVSFPEAKSLIENHKNNFEDVFRHINELYDEICSDIK